MTTTLDKKMFEDKASIYIGNLKAILNENNLDLFQCTDNADKYIIFTNTCGFDIDLTNEIEICNRELMDMGEVSYAEIKIKDIEQAMLSIEKITYENDLSKYDDDEIIYEIGIGLESLKEICNKEKEAYCNEMMDMIDTTKHNKPKRR